MSEPQRLTKALRALLQTGALLMCAAAQAQVPVPNYFEKDFDDEKPWEEIAVHIPPAPAAENLLPFAVTATASQTFAIDAKSVSVGTDEVVRYTLVATSRGGARNVSYEGIRCASFERKLYAFGRPDGGWGRSRRDKWEPITRLAANVQHATLAREYFCDGYGVAGDAAAIVQRIRRQQRLNPAFGGGAGASAPLQEHQVIAVNQFRLFDKAEDGRDFR